MRHALQVAAVHFEGAHVRRFGKRPFASDGKCRSFRQIVEIFPVRVDGKRFPHSGFF